MARHTKRRSRRSRRRKGGAATAYPLSYFNGKAPEASAAPGRDLLEASGMGVRPIIGPVSTVKWAVAVVVAYDVEDLLHRLWAVCPIGLKYIVPMSFYAGYKMFKKSQEKSMKRKTRRTRKR